MAFRNLRRAAACGIVAVVAACAPWTQVRAQALERLHVRDFTLEADNKTPRVGDTFHLIITVHVDEQIAELDNVTLPDLSGFDALGDERRCTATPKGSTCVETISLQPTIPGDRTIASAVLDARDASAKDQPSRFATNTLLLHIAGEAEKPAIAGTPSVISDLLISTVRSFLILLVLASLLWYALWRFTRPRKGTLPPPVVEAPPPVPQPVAPRAFDFDAEYAALVEALRRDPSRMRAFALRDLLRWSLGAQERETTYDIAARTGPNPRIDALRAVEHAAFCEDGRVADHVREALPFLTT